MSGPALEGIRVVEIADQVAGPYCGKLLADLGAEVWKLEPPGGDPARLVGGGDDGETSPLFLYLNTNKKSVVVDLDEVTAQERARDLILRSDVVVESQPHGLLERYGLDAGSLRGERPDLVYTSISAYGRSGPRCAVDGDELTLQHAGGLANLLPSRAVGTELAPCMLGGHQAGYQGALVAALATLGALFGRRRNGSGATLDISLQDVLLALVSPILASHRYFGTTWSRVPDRPPSMGRLQTSDGYIIINAFDDHHFELFRELMGHPEWCAGDEWRSMAYRAHHLMDIAPQIEAWARTREKEDLHRRAGELGIPAGPINDVADVLACRQYQERDFWVDVEHPRAGRQRYPGWPYRMGAGGPSVRRAAPLLDEHSEAAARLVRQEASSRTEAPVPSPLPLAGVRVLELAWVWAGPYAGMMLASLGADVIKVESHRRQDLMRRSFVWPLPEERPRPVPTNQGMAFNAVNLNKRAITVDMSQPEGVELVRQLAARSDIVFDNMRPGALGKLGLGWDDLREVRSDLIVASSSGRGHTGPEREYLGYAMVHQGIGGGAYITGHPEDHPAHSGGDIDIMNAVSLAVALLAALHHREESGEGQFIDYSQCEGVTALLGEVLIEHQRSGVIPERMGNRHARHAPHNVYRAWGADRWVAIEVHDNDQFRALCECIGRSELADDQRFATATARKENEEPLDQVLAGWCRERDRDWIVARLQRAGVLAAPSREGRDLLADPHLRERGSYVTVEHADLGPLELVGPPFRIDGVELPTRPAPRLGEHNREVLGELLGLSERQIEELAERDVIRL